jgi:hypothetical protein
MVRINREDMHVPQRFMPVRVRMRLWSLPTFVHMLVVFVMDTLGNVRLLPAET